MTSEQPREPADDGTEPDPRFTFANERTFLAWSRTALALVVAGLGVVQLLPPFPGVPWGRHVLGVPLIVFGAVVAVVAYGEWVRSQPALRLGQLLREGKFSASSTPSMPVELGLANEEGYPHRGTVDFIDNQLDANTGTLRMRGIFPNKEGLLTPGLFVRIRLPLGLPRRALLVAERALGRDQAQKYLFVVDQENKVVDRRVKVGRLYDGFREVTDGLAPAQPWPVTISVVAACVAPAVAAASTTAGVRSLDLIRGKVELRRYAPDN